MKVNLELNGKGKIRKEFISPKNRSPKNKEILHYCFTGKLFENLHKEPKNFSNCFWTVGKIKFYKNGKYQGKI